MATLSTNTALGPVTIGGVDIPETAASGTFTVPDDLAVEVQRILQQRPGVTITIEGYDRESLFVGPVDPRLMTALNVNAANRASVAAFTVSEAVTVSGGRVWIGTSSGNVDVGIYQGAIGATNLTRIASSGSTASPGTNSRLIAFTASVTLVPGVVYWAAFAADNATVTIQRAAGYAALSDATAVSREKDASFPLPATLASPTTAGNTFGVWFE